MTEPWTCPAADKHQPTPPGRSLDLLLRALLLDHPPWPDQTPSSPSAQSLGRLPLPLPSSLRPAAGFFSALCLGSPRGSLPDRRQLHLLPLLAQAPPTGGSRLLQWIPDTTVSASLQDDFTSKVQEETLSCVNVSCGDNIPL